MKCMKFQQLWELGRDNGDIDVPLESKSNPCEDGSSSSKAKGKGPEQLGPRQPGVGSLGHHSTSCGEWSAGGS